MTEPAADPVSDTTGTIVFGQYRLPALLAGEYTVKVEHKVANTDPAAQDPVEDYEALLPWRLTTAR